nr:MAG TPA: hypothetical protein [Caudoviricetes sp.]
MLLYKKYKTEKGALFAAAPTNLKISLQQE